ncbi:MAG TPA: hypothetical protein VKG63_17365 [Steroidobacteraceae bacterium]|nr:hypothetical protein [Steroidobacteraceae bacterium]
MTPIDLDESYSLLCQTMTRLGRSEAERFLARFAVMALALMPDRGVADRVIAAAADIDRAEATRQDDAANARNACAGLE